MDLINGQINYANFTNYGYLMFYKNYGLPSAANIMQLGDKNGQALYLQATGIHNLLVNDYIEMWGLTLGNTVCYGGSGNTFFAIHRLS